MAATLPTDQTRAKIRRTPSPQQLAANRRNAERSTGPRTEEGKARSRQNAVRHGLTGAGVALPTEDAALVASRFAAVVDDLAPQTTVGLMLAHDIALNFVRVQRAARQETAALAFAQRHAAEEFRQNRLADAEHHIHWIAQEPETHRRRLLQTPEGCDRLILFFEDIRADIRNPDRRWNQIHRSCLAQACGRGKAVGAWRGEALSLALEFDPSQLTDADRREVDIADVRAVRLWAQPQMEAFIDGEIDLVRQHRATLDPATVERDRLEAADRALFDPSRPAALARRYEGAARRNVYRALNELRLVEAGLLPDDPVAQSQAPAPSPVAAEVLAEGDATPDRDPSDDPAPGPAAQTPIDPEDRAPLASFGISAAQASWELSNPVAGEPPIPADQPLPPPEVFGSNAPRRRWT